MRKKPLARYRLQNLTRRDLERGALAATHPDFRGSNETVIWQGGLVPISDLPDEELISRYMAGERVTLQNRSRAQDLGLYELNPDDPSSSILFADSEILFRTRSGWTIAYPQPANFDEDELRKACWYAQVVAAMHRNDPAAEVVSVLRNPLSYRVWKRLEKEGRVVRDENGAVVEVLG